jgi:3',5'-cyclic-AMP phosphodiesterase
MRIVQLSDLHLTAAQGRHFHGQDSHLHFDQALTNSLTLAPDLLLLTGDLAEQPSADLYHALVERLEARWQGPWLWTPGNHDRAADMAEALKRHGRDPEQHQYVRLGRCAIHMLDTHIDDQPAGYLTQQARDRMLQALQQEPADQVLIAGHHPLFPVGTAWLDKHVPEAGSQFAAALAGNAKVRAYLCGHVHQPSDQQHAGLRQLTAPATSVQFAAGSPKFALGASRPAYRWLDLDEQGVLQTGIVQL